MGRDKARLQWQGRAWSTRAAQMLDSLFVETLLVGGDPEADAPGRRVVDPEGQECALRGLVGALEAATQPRVLVLATDLPLVLPDLLLALTAWPEADAVVPVDAQAEQPLCAIYRREACLETARAALASKRLVLRAWLDEIDTARVSLAQLGFAEDEAAQLTNVNTPEDLARLGIC
jgi:molybdopterin-guanine dinucleotide biosynthesis protein A